MKQVRDDRYRATSGPVLQLEHQGHALHVVSTEEGRTVDIGGERHQAITAAELADLLAAAAQRWPAPEPEGPRPSYAAVAVATALDRGMASDLLFWMTDLWLMPIINGVLYDTVIDGAPASDADYVDLGGVGWELADGDYSPAASYGTTWVKRIGSRVFEQDTDIGLHVLGFWDNNDAEFIGRMSQHLYEAGVYDNESDEDENADEDEEGGDADALEHDDGNSNRGRWEPPSNSLPGI